MDILKALHRAGIDADPGLFENFEQLPGFFMARYKDRPEFDEFFFQVQCVSFFQIDIKNFFVPELSD